MKTLRYVALFALSLAPLAAAQDAEPFDPYEAYKAGEAQAPSDPVITEPEIVKPAPMQGMTEAESDAWMAQVIEQSKQDAEQSAIEQASPDLQPSLPTPTQRGPEALSTEVTGEVRSEDGTLLGREETTTFDDGTTEDSLRIYHDKKSVDETTLTEPILEIPAEALNLEPGDAGTELETAEGELDARVEQIEEIPVTTGFKTPVLADLPVAPFYLSAKEYVQYRGTKSQQQVVLQYSVTREKLDSSNIQISSEATLILSDDFAAISNTVPGEPEKLRIYDFKLDRLLSLEPNDTGVRFSNSSLYASAHRNTRLISMMTEKGARDEIDFGKGVILPAYWLESAMSFGAADRIEDIALEIDGRTATATFADEITAQITLSDQAFESDGMSNSQLVFAHHYWPVHPTVLRQIFEAPGPIEKLTYISRGPDDIKGTKYTWTLTGQKAVEKTFPLPALAESIADMAGAPPLAVNLRKTLTTQTPDLGKLSTLYSETENALQAWQNGQRYVTYSGHCAKKSRPAICNEIADMADNPDLPESFKPIAAAAKQSQTKAGRKDALPVLAKAASASDADAAVLYLAGMARARSKAADLSPEMQAFSAEDALTRAVNADPHNPSYLMGLAQYYAANDRFEEAWDLYDTLAVVLSQPAMDGHNIRLPIARVESGLRDLAPAYFLPK